MKTIKLILAFAVIICIVAFVQSTAIERDISNTTVGNSDWHNVDTWEIKVIASGIQAAPVPFDWTPWIRFFYVTVAPFLPYIVKTILDYLKNRGWLKKYKGIIIARERL